MQQDDRDEFTRQRYLLRPNQKLDFNKVRSSTESFWFTILIIFNLVLILPIVWYAISQRQKGPFIAISLAIVGFYWLSQRIIYWNIFGNSIQITESQYPEIYEAVYHACDFLDINPRPRLFVFHGGGILEIFLLKGLSKRGALIFTSEVFDKLLDSESSNQLMMLIGRQLGHIKAGHDRFWFFTDVIGRFIFLFYAAWRRECNYTADKIGMLVAGNLKSARKGLLTITVGKILSEKVTIRGVREQDNILRESVLAFVAQLFEVYPYMIYRILKLEQFERYVIDQYNATEDQYGMARELKTVGFLPPKANVFHIKKIVINGPGNVGDNPSIKL
jgi:Zn-dependent protease with chaperone function